MDYLTRLATRALQQRDTIQPLLPPLFAPRASTGITGPGWEDALSESDRLTGPGGFVIPRPSPAPSRDEPPGLKPSNTVDPTPRTPDSASEIWSHRSAQDSEPRREPRPSSPTPIAPGPSSAPLSLPRTLPASTNAGSPPRTEPPASTPPPAPKRESVVTRPSAETARPIEARERRDTPVEPVTSPPSDRSRSETTPVLPVAPSRQTQVEEADSRRRAGEVRGVLGLGTSGSMANGQSQGRSMQSSPSSVQPRPAPRPPSPPRPAVTRTDPGSVQVQVRIGRVDVRAVMAVPSTPRERSEPRGPRLTLEEYLNGSKGGRP